MFDVNCNWHLRLLSKIMESCDDDVFMGPQNYLSIILFFLFTSFYLFPFCQLRYFHGQITARLMGKPDEYTLSDGVCIYWWFVLRWSMYNIVTICSRNDGRGIRKLGKRKVGQVREPCQPVLQYSTIHARTPLICLSSATSPAAGWRGRRQSSWSNN